MSAFGGKAEVFQNMAKSPLIAKSGSSVGQGQHEAFSHQMVVEYLHLFLGGDSFKIILKWNLPEEVR